MPNNSAIRKIDRAASEAIKGLAKAGVATAHETQGRQGLMSRPMAANMASAPIARSAVTVLAPWAITG